MDVGSGLRLGWAQVGLLLDAAWPVLNNPKTPQNNGPLHPKVAHDHWLFKYLLCLEKKSMRIHRLWAGPRYRIPTAPELSDGPRTY